MIQIYAVVMATGIKIQMTYMLVAHQQSTEGTARALHNRTP